MRSWSLMAIAFPTIAIALVIPSHAQDAASAKAFLVSVYAHYGKNGKGVPFNNRYFHSSLLALIDADEEAAKRTDDIPDALDGDPLCGCQDWDGIWDMKTEIVIKNSELAEATVSFAIFGPKDRTKDDWRKLRITLVPEHGAWRIYDVFDASDPGNEFALRQLIENDIGRLRRSPASPAKQ